MDTDILFILEKFLIFIYVRSNFNAMLFIYERCHDFKKQTTNF